MCSVLPRTSLGLVLVLALVTSGCANKLKEPGEPAKAAVTQVTDSAIPTPSSDPLDLQASIDTLVKRDQLGWTATLSLGGEQAVAATGGWRAADEAWQQRVRSPIAETELRVLGGLGFVHASPGLGTCWVKARTAHVPPPIEMLKSLTFLDVTTVVGAEAVDATADFVWAGSLFGGKLLDQLGVGSRFQARVPVTVTGQADVLTVRFEMEDLVNVALDRGVDASQETLDALRGDVELTVRPEEILAIEKPPADLSLSRQQVVALGDARVKQKCGL